MEMLDKRLNDKGKNWRHVFKVRSPQTYPILFLLIPVQSLTVLDYLLHAGSENVVIYFKDNLYVIKTLKEFQYVDEYGKDQGANVRQKAKDISNLLTDESRLRQERRSRAHMRDRMVRGGGGGDEDENENENENNQRRSRSLPPRRNPDDDELKRAIEESKRSLAEEQAKQGRLTAEERDLQEAIRLSEEAEKNRSKAIDDSNQSALFDEQNQMSVPSQTAIPTPTHVPHSSPAASSSSNPFPLVDAGLQPQFGQGLQPQFTQVQPQFTSFNPYAQQAQQEAMQVCTLPMRSCVVLKDSPGRIPQATGGVERATAAGTPCSTTTASHGPAASSTGRMDAAATAAPASTAATAIANTSATTRTAAYGIWVCKPAFLFFFLDLHDYLAPTTHLRQRSPLLQIYLHSHNHHHLVLRRLHLCLSTSRALMRMGQLLRCQSRLHPPHNLHHHQLVLAQAARELPQGQTKSMRIWQICLPLATTALIHLEILGSCGKWLDSCLLYFPLMTFRTVMDSKLDAL